MWHRRDFFGSAAKTGLALGLAAAGRPLIALPEPGKAPAPGDDVVLLNTALALEHQAIWAYALAGKSGLLSEKARDVGLLFQGSHEIHRDLVADAVKRKGGDPVDAKKEYVFDAPLKTEKDILELAFKLEVGAARAYISVVDKFQDRALSASAAKILSDEVLHATVLRSVLGREVVPQFRLIEN
jgi:ferritin-like protein